jgi:VanZ family protein
MRAALVAGGWLYVAALAWLSLTPEDITGPPFEFGDKVQHFLAYALLMFWFARLYPSGRARLAFGALWLGLGVALEFAQGATGYRSFELADMAANALGVAAGAAAALILPRGAGAAERETR